MKQNFATKATINKLITKDLIVKRIYSDLKQACREYKDYKDRVIMNRIKREANNLRSFLAYAYTVKAI